MNTNTIILGVIAVGITTLVAFKVGDYSKASAWSKCADEQHTREVVTRWKEERPALYAAVMARDAVACTEYYAEYGH
jgi:hypothetical protein